MLATICLYMRTTNFICYWGNRSNNQCSINFYSSMKTSVTDIYPVPNLGSKILSLPNPENSSRKRARAKMDREILTRISNYRPENLEITGITTKTNAYSSSSKSQSSSSWEIKEQKGLILQTNAICLYIETESPNPGNKTCKKSQFKAKRAKNNATHRKIIGTISATFAF